MLNKWVCIKDFKQGVTPTDVHFRKLILRAMWRWEWGALEEEDCCRVRGDAEGTRTQLGTLKNKDQCRDPRQTEGGEESGISMEVLVWVRRWTIAWMGCYFTCFAHCITLRAFSFLVTVFWMHLGLWISYIRLLQMWFDQWRKEPSHTFMNAAHRSWGSSWKSLHSDDSHGIYYCLKPLSLFAHRLWSFFKLGSKYFYNWLILVIHLKCKPISLSLACLPYI